MLKADAEEIKELSSRTGLLGFLRSGMEGFRKTLACIESAERNPRNYDLVLVGTPIWAGNLSSPVRSYLTNFSKRFKKVAFFCTCGSSGEKAFKEMEGICGKPPVAALELTRKEVSAGEHLAEIKHFVRQLKAGRSCL